MTWDSTWEGWDNFETRNRTSAMDAYPDVLLHITLIWNQTEPPGNLEQKLAGKRCSTIVLEIVERKREKKTSGQCGKAQTFFFVPCKELCEKGVAMEKCHLHHHDKHDAARERVRCHALGFCWGCFGTTPPHYHQLQEHVVWTVPRLTWVDTTSNHERRLRNSLLRSSSPASGVLLTKLRDSRL